MSLFLALKGDWVKFSSHLIIDKARATAISIAIVGAIPERSNKSMYKIKSKEVTSATILQSLKSNNYMGSIKENSNIAIAKLEKERI